MIIISTSFCQYTASSICKSRSTLIGSNEKLVNCKKSIVEQENLDYILIFSAFFHQGAPRIIRADCGTENVVTAALQRYFLSNADDVFAAQKSFIYGTTPANQVNRIQCILSVWLVWSKANLSIRPTAFSTYQFAVSLN